MKLYALRLKWQIGARTVQRSGRMHLGRNVSGEHWKERIWFNYWKSSDSALLVFFSVLKPVEPVRDLRTAVKMEGELIKYFICLLMLIILICQKRYLPRCVPGKLPKWILCRTQICKRAIHSLRRINCLCLLRRFFSLALKLISRSRA